jgi:GNAT superfamily N-acetyltransferase
MMIRMNNINPVAIAAPSTPVAPAAHAPTVAPISSIVTFSANIHSFVHLDDPKRMDKRDLESFHDELVVTVQGYHSGVDDDDDSDDPITLGTLKGHVFRCKYILYASALWEMFDAVSEETSEIFQAIEKYMYEEIEAIDTIGLDGSCIFHHPLVILSSMEIDPPYRGQGIGLLAVQWAHDLFGGNTIINPNPLNPSTLTPEQIHTGRKKLRKYWKKLGFTQIARSSYFIKRMDDPLGRR